MPKPYLNKSGFPGPTAYKTGKVITEEEQKVNDLVWICRKIARGMGLIS